MKKEIKSLVKKASVQPKQAKREKEKVQDYYEAESWQFSGCGD